MQQNIKKQFQHFTKVLLVFVLIFAWMFSGWPQIWPLGELGTDKIQIPPKIQEAQAITRTIEQQINIIDQEYTTSSGLYEPTDNSLGLVKWDGSKYNGGTVYFEAVINHSTGDQNTCAALYTAGGSYVEGSEVCTAGGGYERVRTSFSITLVNGTDYTVQLKYTCTLGCSDGKIQAARLIIVQTDGTSITDTETQIEIGNNENTTSESYADLTDKKIYLYDHNKFDPAPTAYFEATLKSSVSYSEATYYFNGYDTSEKWPTTPENMVDSNTATWAKAGNGEATQLNNSNTCDATCVAREETISKVELRVHACAETGDNPNIALRPVFPGPLDGNDHSYAPNADCSGNGSAAYWSEDFDITTDSNAPSPWTWGAIQTLDCDVFFERVGGPDYGYATRVEIIVTYESGAGTAYAQLYNKTNGTVVANSQVSVNSASWTLTRGASALSTNWDTVSDDEYYVQVKTSSGATTYIANAKIILTQSNAGGIDKFETVQQYVNSKKGLSGESITTAYARLAIAGGAAVSGSTVSTSSSSYNRQRTSSSISPSTNIYDTEISGDGSAYTQQDFDNKYDSTKWAGGTFAYYFEAILRNGVGTPNTADIRNSWLIIQVSNLTLETSTLSTGADPGAATIAPGASETDVDQFVITTSTGTETITQVTVNLSTASGLARLSITDNSNVELGFTASPSAGSNAISVSSMSAGTGGTTFKVRVTPKSHANMDAPAGAEYAITAPVTAWVGTGEYGHDGSDTNTSALTIDNLSTDNTASNSGSAGAGQVTISYTNPDPSADDLHSIIVLRHTSAVSDNPVEGTTYTVGNTVVSSTVACVDTSVVEGGADSCVDTNVSNGTAYHYKIFAKDSHGNYATGIVPASSPFTPIASNIAQIHYRWRADDEGESDISDGQDASNLLGQLTATDAPIYTKSGVNNSPNNRGVDDPTRTVIDTVNHRLFVADRDNHRVLVFNLDASNNLVDRVADNVLGQEDFRSNTAVCDIDGMDTPRDVEYDSSNNRLFVADYGNNRVTVFDVASITNGEDASNVLGQENFDTSAAVCDIDGMNAPNNVEYDSSNNRLFVVDSYNHRVTVFDVASITNGEDASNVLGQEDFDSAASICDIDGMYNPYGVAYDSSNNRLFVADYGNNRVTVFDVASITNGEDASNVLGQENFDTSAAVCDIDGMYNPYSVEYDSSNSRLFVADSYNHRVTVFDVASITNGEDASNVLGQEDFNTCTNVCDIDGMNYPFGVAYDSSNSRLFVADTLNNRVTVFDVASISNGEDAVNLLGQLTAADTPIYTKSGINNSPNNRGVRNPARTAIDTVNHRLFVADRSNNRVLVFNLDNSNNLVDRVADNVLGQEDFRSNTAVCDIDGMNYPHGVEYDSSNNRLFVADSENNRVLVFDVASISNGEDASNVLGQENFDTSVAVCDIDGMYYPYSVEYDSSNSRLFVADRSNNRVTVFDVTSITNGEDASNVLGQEDFNSAATVCDIDGMDAPYSVEYDSSNSRLFVADRSNNRVLVFDVASITNGEDASNVLGQENFDTSVAVCDIDGMNAPRGVGYDSSNSRLFVADRSNNRVLVFDVASITNGEDASNVLGQEDFNTSVAVCDADGMNSPRGVEYDSSNNRLFVADYNNNRVTVFDFLSASWKADEDVNISNVNKTENIRLRISAANTGGSAVDYNYRLQYAVGDGSCNGAESYIDVPVTATTQHFDMTSSTYVANTQSTTAQFNNTETYTFTTGKIVTDSSNQTGNITIANNHYTEVEYNFQATTNATAGGYYCFRVRNSATDLDGYDRWPQLQIAGAASPTLTFAIPGDNSITFGNLNIVSPRWAGDSAGSEAESSAHTLTASTNSTSGYSITVKGDTLKDGGNSITAIGDTPTSVASGGSEQFGIRITSAGNNCAGSEVTPYNGAANMYGYNATASTADEIVSCSSASETTTYSMYYAGNIAGDTAQGDYTANLIYICTGNF